MDIRKSSFMGHGIVTVMLLLATSVQAQVPNSFRQTGQMQYCSHKSYKDVYSGDRNNVFYKGRLVQYADPMTFRDMGFGYGRDRMNVYFEGAIIPHADPVTFKIYRQSDTRNMRTYEQPDILPEEEMPGTAFSDGYSKDNINVYYMGRKIEDATASSFHELDDGYAKDAFHVYFMGRNITDATVSSFELLGDGYAKDAFAAFYLGLKIEDATASSFIYIGHDMAKDAFNKYFRGKKIEND